MLKEEEEEKEEDGRKKQLDAGMQMANGERGNEGRRGLNLNLIHSQAVSQSVSQPVNTQSAHSVIRLKGQWAKR